MPRFMTIWLPRWPVQRRLLERPELRRVPVFVCRRERRGAMTVVSWAWAEPPPAEQRRAATRRVSRGRSSRRACRWPRRWPCSRLAHGSRACHVAEVEADDPSADLARARAAGEMVPAVFADGRHRSGRARHGRDRPECLHLDVTGTAGFFGGEEPLVRTAVWTLAARGLHARAAIADTCPARPGPPPITPTCSTARVALVARPRGRSWCIAGRPVRRRRRPAGPLHPGGVALRSCRVGEATRCSPVCPWRRCGSTTPRPPRSARWGSTRSAACCGCRQGAWRRGFRPCSRGGLAEFRGSRRRADRAAVRWRGVAAGSRMPSISPCGRPTCTRGMLIARDRAAAGPCLAPLVARGEGVLTLQVRLEEAAAGWPTAPTVIDVGPLPAECVAAHLVDLVRLRLAALRLPGEIEGVAVEVVAAGTVSCRQRLLFGRELIGGAGVVGRRCGGGMLLDRLAGRLGRTAVFEPQAGGRCPAGACVDRGTAGDTGRGGVRLRVAIACRPRVRDRCAAGPPRRRALPAAGGRSGCRRGRVPLDGPMARWWRSCPTGRRCGFGSATAAPRSCRPTGRSGSRRPGGAGRPCGATTTSSRRSRGSGSGCFRRLQGRGLVSARHVRLRGCAGMRMERWLDDDAGPRYAELHCTSNFSFLEGGIASRGTRAGGPCARLRGARDHRPVARSPASCGRMARPSRLGSS